MNEQQLLDLLKATRKKIEDQGRIVDDRLIEKEKQIRKALKEIGEENYD